MNVIAPVKFTTPDGVERDLVWRLAHCGVAGTQHCSTVRSDGVIAGQGK